MNRLLLFDLDGTLLRPKKDHFAYQFAGAGRLPPSRLRIGIATARYAGSAQAYVCQVQPDVLITSCGALPRYRQNSLSRRVCPR